MIIDIHVHLLADSDVEGCKMSHTMKGSLAGHVAAALLDAEWGNIVELLEEDLGIPHSVGVPSSRIANYITGLVATALHIDGAVLLAMDSIYDSQGCARPEWSHLVVTNDYARGVVENTALPSGKKLLFGASIHPYRADALEELERVKALGAVLVKWVPSSQHFELHDARTVAFAARASELGIPLLIHQGPESAIPIVPDSDEGTSPQDRDEGYWRTQENPKLLDAILDTGATVIVAHCAAPWEPFTTREVQQYDEVLTAMLNQADANQWNLYADISAALFGPIRAKAVRGVLASVSPKQIVYGSDFPIPTQDISMGGLGPIIDRAKHREGRKTHNALDMDYLFKASYQIDPSIFANTAVLLGLA